MAVWTISQGLTEKEYGFLAHIWCKPDAKDERIIEDEIHHCLNFGLPRLTTKLLSDNLTNVYFWPIQIILYVLTRISYSYCQLSCSWNPPLNISPLERVWWWFQGKRDQKSCWYLQHYSLCPIKFKFWVLVFHFTKQKALCSPSPSLLEGKLVSPSEDCVS